MRTGAGAPGLSAVPEAGAVAIIAALASESRAFGVPPPGCWLLQSGPGPAAARASARQAVDRGAAALLSWGLAGGLVPAAVTGRVIVPRRFAAPGGGESIDASEGWRASLVALLRGDFELLDGILAAADMPVTTTSAKAGLAKNLAAAAVDMESFAIADVARSAGVPCVAVRVIVDAADDALPADIGAFVSPAGRVRLHRAVWAALRSGRDRRLLRALGRRSAKAHAVLGRVAAVLADSGCAPPAAVRRLPA